MSRKNLTLVPALLLPALLAGTSGALLLNSGEDQPQPGRTQAGQNKLGASGTLPQERDLSPELLGRAGSPKELATGAGPPVEAPHGVLDIPGPMLTAYVEAAEDLKVTDPGCGVHWSVLASIGRIESGHARGGRVDTAGTTVSAILGPRLSGGPEVSAIPDTDGGKLDGDPVWDRAVGAMQFIPETWRKHAADGNHDGAQSPHNVRDATAAAGRYLCEGGDDLRNPVDLAAAVFSYNHSESYVRTVLVWAAAYALGVTPTPTDLAPEVSEDEVLAGNRLPDRPESPWRPVRERPDIHQHPEAHLALPAPGPSNSGEPSGPRPPPGEAPPPLVPGQAGSKPEPSGGPPNGQPLGPNPTAANPTAANPTGPNPTGADPTGEPPAKPSEHDSPEGPEPSKPMAPPVISSNVPVPEHGGDSAAPPHPSAGPVPPGKPEPSSPGPPTTAAPATGSAPPPSTSASSPSPSGKPTSGEAGEPSSSASEYAESCDPAVLNQGDFVTDESQASQLAPGETLPSDALPGGIVYVGTAGSGGVEPCRVPEGFDPKVETTSSTPLTGETSAPTTR